MGDTRRGKARRKQKVRQNIERTREILTNEGKKRLGETIIFNSLNGLYCPSDMNGLKFIVKDIIVNIKHYGGKHFESSLTYILERDLTSYWHIERQKKYNNNNRIRHWNLSINFTNTKVNRDVIKGRKNCTIILIEKTKNF